MQVLSGAGLFTSPGAGSGVHWVEHLRVSDLSVGTYSVPADAADDQEPHTEDEIYVVTAGRRRWRPPGGRRPSALGPSSTCPPVSRTASPASPATWPSWSCSLPPSTHAPVTNQGGPDRAAVRKQRPGWLSRWLALLAAARLAGGGAAGR